VQVEKNDSYQGTRLSDAANGRESVDGFSRGRLARQPKAWSELYNVVACLKACPDTNLLLKLHHYRREGSVLTLPSLGTEVPRVTRKATLLLSASWVVVTSTVPVVAPVGTVAWISVSEIT
jgi:hypothetical protein